MRAMSPDLSTLPDPPAVPESRWLRNPLNWILPIFTSLMVLGASAEIEPSKPVEVASYSVVTLMCMVAATRFALAGARADRAGLRIRGIIRTRLVAWDDIVPPVRMESWRLLPGVPIVRTRQGARIPIIVDGDPSCVVAGTVKARGVNESSPPSAATYSRSVERYTSSCSTREDVGGAA